MNLKWLPALALATQLHAANIDLGEDRVSTLEGFAFSDLNGTRASEQVSFDLLFNNNVHVFAHTTFFSVGLDFSCLPTNFLTGTASLLDINGQVLASGVMGSFITDDGIMDVGFYPFNNDSYDFYGVHFDLNVPATTITRGEFYLSGQDKLFRIGPHIPDKGPTLGLFFLALLTLFFYDKKAVS